MFARTRLVPENDDRRLKRAALAAVIVVFLVTAGAYALNTPVWEAPDEPAHYNYIRTIATQGRLPVLQAGDYPFDYLEQLKAARFPPGMSIDSIRYESWQPPLYYVAAAPLFWLTRGLPLASQLILLRLFSVALGAVLLWLIHRLVSEAFPSHPTLALLTTAIAATVPMHVAVSASLNNDILCELLLTWAALLSLRTLREPAPGGRGDRRRLVVLGLALGLGLLTKMTAVIGIGLAVAALVGQTVDRRLAVRSLASRVGWVLGPAALLAAPWLIRNLVVYGGLDLFAWARHSAVVEFQPRTAEWLARLGPGGLAREFAVTTFRSFWAQFGWMGVIVDGRIYLGLALLSAVLLFGILFYAVRIVANRASLIRGEWGALGLAALWIGLTVFLYLAYNAQFVQHQGRYLFAAMPALALLMALGWREALRPTRARLLASLGLVAILVGLAGGLAWSAPLKTLLPLLSVGALGFALAWRLGEERAAWGQLLLYVGLVTLDWICLVRFIIPALRS